MSCEGGVDPDRQTGCDDVGRVVDDPLAAGTQMGPVVSLPQMEKVVAAVNHARTQGATVTAPPLDVPVELQGGYYVPVSSEGTRGA
jgi:acyl-CoA reductase-like NAD-dependent aldehyde dehydrogenase